MAIGDSSAPAFNSLAGEDTVTNQGSEAGGAAQLSPSMQSILNSILTQIQPSIYGGQLSALSGINDLGVNSAMYGPGGVLQTQAQNQYGFDTQRLGLSTQGLQQQQGIDKAQYGLTLGGLQQQLAENANQYSQGLFSQHGQAGASGATNTVGNQNALSQLGLQYGPGGFNEQSINRSIQSAGLNEALSQGNIQRALQGNNISGQELYSNLQSGIQSLGLQGATSADSILQQLGSGLENLGPQVASAISQIATAGGIPNIFSY